MADSWLEPRTRIPFVGIIAMVIIVAVVAVFIKTQLSPLFPTSEVTVESGREANVAGKASSSFYGVREVPLKQVTLLQGVITTQSRSLTIVIDAQAKLASVRAGERLIEVELHEDGDALVSTFEYDSVMTRITVDPEAGMMIMSEPGTSATPISVALSERTILRGFFTVRSAQHRIEFNPAESAAMISGGESSRVTLTQDGSMYRGEWTEVGKSHPVSIDARKRMATIEDVF